MFSAIRLKSFSVYTGNEPGGICDCYVARTAQESSVCMLGGATKELPSGRYDVQ